MHYSISEIPTDDATIYGLHENIKPVDENPSFMLQNLQYLFSYFVNEQENKVEEYP